MSGFTLKLAAAAVGTTLLAAVIGFGALQAVGSLRARQGRVLGGLAEDALLAGRLHAAARGEVAAMEAALLPGAAGAAPAHERLQREQQSFRQIRSELSALATDGQNVRALEELALLERRLAERWGQVLRQPPGRRQAGGLLSAAEQLESAAGDLAERAHRRFDDARLQTRRQAALTAAHLSALVAATLALVLLAVLAIARTVGRAWEAQRRATAEAAASRDRYADLVEGMEGAIVWEADAHTLEPTFFNRNGVRRLGWPGQAGTLTWAAWERFVPEDDCPRMREALVAAREKGTEQVVDHRLLTASGETRHFHTSIHRSAGGAGKPVLRGLSFDVTALREAEERLRLSEQRLRLLVEGIEDYAIFLLDPAGRVASWSPGAKRIWGLSEEEILGQGYERCFTDADRAAGVPERQLAEARRTGWLQTEGFRKRRGGGRFWAEVTLSALRSDSGELVGFAAVGRDATERKRAEEIQRLLVAAGEALGPALDYEATLQRATSLAVPSFADSCVLVLAGQNGEIERLLMASHDEESRERLRTLFERYAPRPSAEHGLGRVLQTGRAELQEVVTPAVLDGIARSPEHRRLLEGLGLRSFLAAPLLARGRILGAVEFLLTRPHRRYEPRDVEVGLEIARRVALAVDNAQLYREAQEAVRARDAFLSVASHELKTPLTPFLLQVQGLLQLARRHPDGAVPLRELEPRLELLDRQAHRLGRLVTNLLDISRVTAGSLTLASDPVDLAALVREVVSRLHPELARAGCALTLRADQPVLGRWDRARLEQVVGILLGNALKYGAGRPVEVTVEGDSVRARVVVRDHGIGIAERDRARLFERAVSERHYGGFGLGLWTVRQIVRALGGEIHVQSEPGRGSTFTVDLPRSAPPRRPGAAAPATARRPPEEPP